MDRSLDSRFSIKGQLILLLVIVLFVFFTVLFIMDNGNIHMDGTNEKKYLQRKTVNYFRQKVSVTCFYVTVIPLSLAYCLISSFLF